MVCQNEFFFFNWLKELADILTIYQTAAFDFLNLGRILFYVYLIFFVKIVQFKIFTCINSERSFVLKK